jgi:molybdenum cofactor cytidylyltransferase
MIFGRVAVAEATGVILAHTTRVTGSVLPKGVVLTPDMVGRLRDAGHEHVIGARLEAGDVAENEAARRLADALAGPGLARTRPGTGRTNLVAAHAGLFRADAARIDEINALHEGITVATLADATTVRAGSLLATVKIIPFAIPGGVLAQSEQLARAAPPLRLPPFRPLRAGLVVTELPGLKASVLRGTIDVTTRRTAALGGHLLAPLRVAHAEQPIADALRTLAAQGAELLLVAGASATVDRGDVGPAAIVLAGGVIDHFGMPVDPGNLICAGHIGSVPAVVLPGCARSPALNGIDFLLARLFAGEPAGSADIARMGVGGLLKEFAARPVPRLAAAPPPRIAAIVLAAGLSSRMAPRNKLLLPDAHGTPMIARTVDAVLASHARPVLVVTGHMRGAIEAALAGRPVTIVPAPDYEKGLSASLRAGIAALPPEIGAALICLGDMPLVSASDIDTILDAYDATEGRLIVVPVHGGQRGNPVLWDRRFFAAMAALTGDSGARALIGLNSEYVAEIEFPTAGVVRDFDGPQEEAVLF